MIRRVFAAAGVGIVACVAACTTTPRVSGDTRVVDRLAIAPYAAHEACFDLGVGDRLDYRFQGSEPIDFDIRYRESNAVISPIVRERSTADSDIFEARVAARYCLQWQAGADGAIIGYRASVRRAGK